ncbi:glycosyltransferase [Dyadobacter bucti]|uniref:glycosyltransferase n=1 Tax=Dyadobacter bucti TaxID=2572203 RepID=UPI001108B81C|nr:glycosyltransferase [Dyadobacter bucti]
MVQTYLLSWLIPLLSFLIMSYAIFTFMLLFLWKRIKPVGSDVNTEAVWISVIVPVRNEAENIKFLLEDLSQQIFPKNQFELLVTDDSSVDNTAEIVRQYAAISNYTIRLISLPDIPTTSPKKRAIETAITHASGNLIVTTDGDCRVGSGWLQSIAASYAATGAKLISSPVTFTQETSLTDHLQTVEFASLIGSGAAAISAGHPSLCNGANLAYQKEVFQEVNGFEGVKHIASGDDEFLMHKIAARYPGGIYFLKDPAAIVSTKPHKSWGQFFRQRKRWASKWKHYQSKTPLILALYIFSCNFSLLLAGLLCISGNLGGAPFLILIAAKCIPEWFFLGTVLRFLQKPASLLYIPVTQVFYSFYVCFFGLAAQKPEYEWKGRKLV